MYDCMNIIVEAPYEDGVPKESDIRLTTLTI